MRITVTNDDPGYSSARVAVLIQKKEKGTQIARVLKGGESLTHEAAPSDKITVGQKWEEDE